MLTRSLVVSLGVVFGSLLQGGQVGEYRGVPYEDGCHTAGAQKVPGKIECAFYDIGGEGIAYHDSDAKNQGSGGLNPADGTYLNEFRKDEGVDTSYTKYHDSIDNSPYDLVQPSADLLYVGWTEPGEWFRITVDATHAGTYSMDLLYTSNRGGTVSVDVNGKDATGPLQVQSTYNAADPIAWRQWHHWNRMTDMAVIQLGAGRSVLTVHTLSGGNMNLQSFDFKEVLHRAGGK
ncbi:hypothetical protein [Granulicella sibirica]|uniref:Cell surface protein n=1 Tax=Granulicella sibirica TaxID=2479048 RepID=A0A4Q0T3C3_9BACT|nr:hypothetical protein [Granulicella sibirica]RXH56508.1 cell surface protein [Granulicella sibirica]